MLSARVICLLQQVGEVKVIIERRSNVVTYLKLKASTNSKTYHTEFTFNANASQGLDPVYDAAIWNETPPSFAIYSHLVQDDSGIAMALQALKDTDLSNVVIPLGVNATANETLTFSILESTLPIGVSVSLEDAVSNTFTLLNNSDYTITPSESISGMGRFYLRINADVLSTIDKPLDNLKIYTHRIQKTIVIDGQLQSQTELKLYDIHGRVVNSKDLDITSSNQTIDVSQLSTGIYIVELVSNTNQKRIQKLIIK